MVSFRQKIVLWSGVLLVVGTGVCPPWITRFGPAGNFKRPLGCHWLFLPPQAPNVDVDLSRLLIQWAMIGLVTASVCWAWPEYNWSILSRRNAPATNPEMKSPKIAECATRQRRKRPDVFLLAILKIRSGPSASLVEVSARRRRERNKERLLEVGLAAIYPYLQELGTEWEFDKNSRNLIHDLEPLVVQRLNDALTGDESNEHVTDLVRQIVWHKLEIR
jgi:hypothetical protein